MGDDTKTLKQPFNSLALGPAVGEISSDIALEQIPLSEEAKKAVDTLTEGDDKPLWVAVEIQEGPGSHGNYKSSALQAVVSQVNEREPMGFLGHQKQEDLPYEFPDPTTHWFAAEMRQAGEASQTRAVARIYGLVDQAFTHLRRWIRAKRIREVSIYGLPKYEMGTRNVVDYDLYSIDWTPRDRAGMETDLVWTSEMEDPRTRPDEFRVEGELDGSYDEVMGLIDDAIRDKFRDSRYYVYAYRYFPDYIIARYHGESEGNRDRGLWKIPYQVVEDQGKDEVTLGDPSEVVEQKSYEAVGDDTGSDEDNYDEGGVSAMGEEKKRTISEMLADVRSAIAKGETSMKDVLAELGITGEQAMEVLGDDTLKKLRSAAEVGKKLYNALGFTEDTKLDDAVTTAGEMKDTYTVVKDREQPAQFVGELMNTYAEQNKKQASATLDESIKEKVKGEQAQLLIKRLVQVDEDADKEQICGEIDKLLEDKEVKSMISKLHTDDPVPTGESGSKKTGFKSGKSTKVKA